jgi:hypothetical protein
VSLRVALENPAASRSVRYVLPGFVAGGSFDGSVHLLVDVWGPNDEKLEARPVVIIADGPPTHPLFFVGLHPGQFMGQHLALTSGAFLFNMERPGVYRVAVSFSSEARSWFKRWLSAGHDLLEAPFEQDALFDGVVSAKPVQVTVRASGN